jgi:hypothetical protein
MLVFLSAALAGAQASGQTTRAFAEATVSQKETLATLQERSYFMERVMHASLAKVDPTVKRRLQSASTPRERDRILIERWKRMYRRTSATYRNPPFLAALTCIHHNEGSWNDRRNPTYDGGLQMNFAFEERYGDFLLRMKGRAYNWTPLEQIWTAVYAIRGPDHRGFYPWPVTARDCNLI